MPNGLFWTQSIPHKSFQITHGGRKARLFVNHLPMPDTFFFSNNVAVSGEVKVDIRFEGTSAVKTRGKGNSVKPEDPAYFTGQFRDAKAYGSGWARITGWKARTGQMDATGFFAELGYQRNGVWLA